MHFKDPPMAAPYLPTSDIYIVDDDLVTRDALSVIFTLAGYRATVFPDAESFLGVARSHTPAAVLLDMHLPDKSGLTVLRELNAATYEAPVFIVSGDSDLASAIESVKSGAFDYILKPFDARDIVARVGNAVALYAKRHARAPSTDGLVVEFSGRTLLTPRERDVLAQIAAGASNKEAGRRLGISPRTVEVHRARIMEKIGARNAADLVRIVLGGNSSRSAPEPVPLTA